MRCIGIIVLALLAPAFLSTGCASSSSSGPSVSGFGVGSSRTVSRGNEVVIRIPAAGETEVVLTRSGAAPDAPGEQGERRRFRIRIRS